MRDEETRCVMKERPSSLLSGGRASSSPAITSGTGTGVGAGDDVVATGRARGDGGSTATPPKTVVTAVVHPQTPDGHSRANKVCSEIRTKDGGILCLYKKNDHNFNICVISW